ncbi:uncharacterized protein PgNI_03488 [Pyricularia grisea]|uniref:Uncharacterized protein n=1 Tax=Pyricularia grisea TaxID=148305 RepID=A0A6P8BEB8_PYRGI|nr:uncharacterized protein PgNI_03488 [Pyricularia grisea]TLD14042.1 hypothetical protein PgNI_03488 [Pyricularia grisea]
MHNPLNLLHLWPNKAKRPVFGSRKPSAPLAPGTLVPIMFKISIFKMGRQNVYSICGIDYPTLSA